MCGDDLNAHSNQWWIRQQQSSDGESEKSNLQMRHEEHVAGGVELVADGLEEDRAQHRPRLGPLITMPVRMTTS